MKNPEHATTFNDTTIVTWHNAFVTTHVTEQQRMNSNVNYV